MTEGAAGFDITLPAPTIILPGQIKRIELDLSLEIPRQMTVSLELRSSVAAKGLILLGGRIDSDYRYSLFANLCNVGSDSISLKKGTRFAQLVFQLSHPVHMIAVNKVRACSQRGCSGSTGE